MNWRRSFVMALALVVVALASFGASVAFFACLAAALEALCRVPLGMGDGARLAATVAALVVHVVVGLTLAIRAISAIVGAGAGGSRAGADS